MAFLMYEFHSYRDEDKTSRSDWVKEGWKMLDGDDPEYESDRAIDMFHELDVDIMNSAYVIGIHQDGRWGLFGPQICNEPIDSVDW